MYVDFFQLRELPFELTPNPKFLYFTSPHREALSMLQYGLSAAKPVTVLIGEAGTGKTTLLKAALDSDLCRNVRCVSLNNPALSRSEFVQMLATRFELGATAAESKATMLVELERVLRARAANGERNALVVDEAQSLSRELLEEIRLLANIETATEKLLPLVLAGQPEFADRLNEPSLRQLKQRVALRCEIRPFDLSETAAYVDWRIRTAGGDASKLFTRDAITLIYERSLGIPRAISVMCDNALINAMGLGRRAVDRAVVLEVCNDFAMPGATAPSPQGAVGPAADAAAPPTPYTAGELFTVVNRRRLFGVFRRSGNEPAASNREPRRA